MDTICPEIRVDKTQADERAWQVWADQVVGEVAEVVRQQLHGVRPDEGEDLRVIEHRVQAVLRPVGKALLEACGSRAAEDLPRPLCCGRPMHRAHRRPRAMQGAVGDWDLTRTEYVCDHCGRRHVPADEFWGIGSGQCSPLMAELASRAGAEIPSFDRAAALLGQTLGTSVCGDTLGRTSEAVGLVAELEQREAMALARRLLTEPTGDLAPRRNCRPIWSPSGVLSSQTARPQTVPAPPPQMMSAGARPVPQTQALPRARPRLPTRLPSPCCWGLTRPRPRPTKCGGT